VTIAEIISMTGFSRPTLYRWMSHPVTHRIPRFPRPINQPCKPAKWDEHEVRAWWEQNKERCGLWGRGHNEKDQ
jgi:predicted DNA-binding transcriptional regulator AlpA